MKILNKKVVTTRKPMLNDQAATRKCDCCGKDYPIGTRMLRGKVRERLATTWLYICSNCSTIYGEDTALQKAHDRLRAEITTMLKNAPSL